MNPNTGIIYASIAIGVGLAVRMLKDDRFVFPPRWHVPSGARPILAQLLGSVGYSDVLGTNPTRKVFFFDGGADPTDPTNYVAFLNDDPQTLAASGIFTPAATMHAVGSSSSAAATDVFNGGIRAIIAYDHVPSPRRLRTARRLPHLPRRFTRGPTR